VFPEEATLKRDEGDAANASMLAALQWRVAISPFYRGKSNNTNGYLRMRQNYSATQTEGLPISQTVLWVEDSLASPLTRPQST
jgi:hypothetical protein